VLGQLPAVLPRHVAQQPTQIRQHPLAWLGAGEPSRDAGVQGVQPRRPRMDFLNLCRLVGLQHRLLLPSWRVTAGPSPAGGQERTASPQPLQLQQAPDLGAVEIADRHVRFVFSNEPVGRLALLGDRT
jgi:hypothetical protein